MDLLIYLSKYDSNYFSSHQMLHDQLILLTEYKYTFVKIIIVKYKYKSLQTKSTVPTELLRSSNTYAPNRHANILSGQLNCSQNKRANVGDHVSRMNNNSCNNPNMPVHFRADIKAVGKLSTGD